MIVHYEAYSRMIIDDGFGTSIKKATKEEFIS